MALRLSTQLALSRSSVTLTAAQVAALEDIFGLITQDGRSFLLSQNETKLLLQLADKNVMITQSLPEAFHAKDSGQWRHLKSLVEIL